MKWLVLLIVFGMPLSVQAEPQESGVTAVVSGPKYDLLKVKKSFWINLESEEDGNYIRAQLRFYIPRQYTDEPIPKGRCQLAINNRLQFEEEDFFIAGTNGPELWASSLVKKDHISVTLRWENVDPHIEFLSVEVESNTGTQTEIWKHMRAEKFFTKEREAERAEHYREFSLDDVCQFY